MRAVRPGSPRVLVRCRLRSTSLRGRSLERLARRILRATGDTRTELSLELVGDRRMRRLNRLYRGVDAPTDVLSFPMSVRRKLGVRGKGLGVLDSRKRFVFTPHPSLLTPHPLLGDVVISLDTAARQAAADRQTVDQAVARLLIHGILHLRGYDHERGAREARRMRAKERVILKSITPIPKLVTRRQ